MRFSNGMRGLYTFQYEAYVPATGASEPTQKNAADLSPFFSAVTHIGSPP